MNPKLKSFLLWTFSVIFMMVFVVYQRLTGPTHPSRGKVEIAGETVKYKLLRSWGNEGDAKIEVEVEDQNINGIFKFRRFKSHDEWSEVPNIILSNDNTSVTVREEPVILRFTGIVPKYILYPHILLMFLAMVFSIRAGIEAYYRRDNIFKFTQYTVILFFLGGLILGPIVQKYAFDALWTGWPFGHDLTDNKTLVAFVFWVIAMFKTMKDKKHRTWVLIATAALIAVYLIPHSVLGSEIDFTQVQNK
ncbi:MAG: hypothetical protein CVU00_09225 [Bacteroidetes bacterium HGW-Bacteroidetes-17]|nr:MAG: hypothetical protein CVU00_09225 [Bacteroidetes bacterium HGW-Bacteroidetes-17]